jgi:hypothetical protein
MASNAKQPMAAELAGSEPNNKTPRTRNDNGRHAEIDQSIDNTNSGAAAGGGSANDTSQAQTTAANFMSKFRDKDTRVLKNLNSQQFMEVWNNYDKDGKFARDRCRACSTLVPRGCTIGQVSP